MFPSIELSSDGMGLRKDRISLPVLSSYDKGSESENKQGPSSTAALPEFHVAVP